jgi:hypothetical protein
VLEEAERSLHDALCVIRCLVQKRFLVTGGASPEVEVSYQLSKWSKMLQVRVEAGAEKLWFDSVCSPCCSPCSSHPTAISGHGELLCSACLPCCACCDTLLPLLYLVQLLRTHTGHGELLCARLCRGP